MHTSEGVVKNVRVYLLAFISYFGIVLFGYDTGIAGGIATQPYFQKNFGMLNPNGSKNTKKVNDLSSNVVSVLQAGAFFGALGSAPLSNWIGRRWTLMVFTIIFSIGAILTTIAGGSRGLSYIYAGRIVSGIGIGGISAVAPAYVSECSPKNIRGRITGLFQVMVAIGVMLSYFINYGVSIHMPNSTKVWRIPFGFQLVPAGILAFGLLTVRESPRWLASKGNTAAAIANLAYLRRDDIHSEAIRHEYAEIEAQIIEEREARKGLGLQEAFFGKGNFVRFVIAFVIFLLQQWSGQNSVSYYAPQIFTSIGYLGHTNSLLASGIYGRRNALLISAMGMGALFYIIGAILKTHPPIVPAVGTTPPPAPASKAMAAMLYIYVCFYSMGCGPLPWVYVADIFPTRTRHYGLAFASATQWLFNFVVAKVTPTLETNLGYKLFLMFATINIGMAVFAWFLPETKGRSLEDMDVIFGAVGADKRQADILKYEKALDQERESNEMESVRSGDRKV